MTGGTVQLANTAPDVNLDEVLGALDSDTQAYLRLLLVSGGQAVDGRARTSVACSARSAR